ncbi:hypothetical protein K502DRAFT_352278 [Neoconidiobolus thromboides FSU 785]|nr:hypothetical protein K502DRAFT_352278 [Neoconidiobolus thromboides FSU 785]
MTQQLPDRYFEGMEERLVKLELALVKSKVLPPSLQKGDALDNESLFEKYVQVMEVWTEKVSYREEPLLNKLVTKYYKAIKEHTLDNRDELLLAMNESSLSYKEKLLLMLQNFNSLVNAVNQIESAYALEGFINPPEFKGYIRPIERINSVIEKFDGFIPSVNRSNQDILLVMETFNQWCDAVGETLIYLEKGIERMDLYITRLEKRKQEQT